MVRRKMTDKLIKRSQINEEIRLINRSETNYISSKGNIYKDYGNDLFYPKTNFVNKNNGYLYSGITYLEGQKQRRVHILVAETFLPNPNNYTVVMHKDNNKANPEVSNLEWGLIQKILKMLIKMVLLKMIKVGMIINQFMFVVLIYRVIY